MMTENNFCSKCGSNQKGNNFCSKCGNNLIINTHKELSKNQKEDISNPVIDENYKIEQQQFNSLMGNVKKNKPKSKSFVAKYPGGFGFLFGILSLPLLALGGVFIPIWFILWFVVLPVILFKIHKSNNPKP